MMGNMSYCRHENTYNDLQDVWDKWGDFDEEEASVHERGARKQIIRLVKEMAEALEGW